MFRLLILVLSITSCTAQWGGRGQQQQQQPHADGGVDAAMQGWEQLAKNPDQMAEVMASFRDPEVVAKAQEMINDPVYMAAANKKMAELKAKAQGMGMLDQHGMPVAGAATAAAEAVGGANLAQMMAGGAAARGAGAGASEYAGAGGHEYEMENLARHRAGELNDAELGMANLQKAVKDPSAMAEMAKMMQDPENQAALQKMMSDPSFQAQAKRVAAQMQASGAMPDAATVQKMMQDPNIRAKAQQMAQAMGMGGMGGMGGLGGSGGGAGGAANEIERLRRENAALKQAMGA